MSSATPQIDKAANRLWEVLKKHTSKDCVAVSLHYTATTMNVEFHFRPVDALKVDGISMRNMSGEFIK